MASIYVNLISNLSWSIFWITVVIFIVAKEFVTRSAHPKQPNTPILNMVLGTTLPALIVASGVAFSFQLLLPSVLPAIGIASATESTSETLIEQGETMFRTKGCFGCHTIQGVSEIGKIGPELSHIARKSLIAGQEPYTPENLRKWLTNPHEVKPGTKMPNMNLSEEQLDAIVAYLDSLK